MLVSDFSLDVGCNPYSFPASAQSLARRYVYEQVWESFPEEGTANEDTSRERFMAKVLAAGAWDMLRALPGLAESGYKDRISERKNTDPFGDTSWRCYFQSRGAALLLQKEVMKFLIRSDMRDVPFYIKIEMNPCCSLQNSPSIRLLEAATDLLSSSSAPLPTKEMLNVAIEMLKLIQCPEQEFLSEHHGRLTKFMANEIQNIERRGGRPEPTMPQGSLVSHSHDSRHPGHSASSIRSPRLASAPYPKLRPSNNSYGAESSHENRYAQKGGKKGILSTMYRL